MRRFPRTLAAFSLALLALWTGCAKKEEPASSASLLPNGLTVVALENRSSDLVSVQAWVRDGALYETPEQAGEAALLAHTLFESGGAEGVGDVARAVEALGGWFSVGPSYDFVSYVVTAPAEHVDRTVSLLAEALMRPAPVAESVPAKKKVLLSSQTAEARHPMSRAVRLAFRAILGEHPYARPSQGTGEGLERITVERLRARHRERYVPGNIVMVVAGNVDPARARALIERAFSDASSDVTSVTTPLAQPAAWPKEPVRRVEYADITRAYQAVAFPAPSVQDPDNVVMDLALMVVGRGRSSRLHRVLVEEKKLVGSVRANWATRTQPCPFVAWMDLPVENLRAAEEATVGVLRSLADDPVDGAELAKAKMILESEILFMNETAQEQGAYHGYWTILGGTGFVDDYLAHLKTVTADDITRVARLYFSADGYGTGAVVPRSAKGLG